MGDNQIVRVMNICSRVLNCRRTMELKLNIFQDTVESIMDAIFRETGIPLDKQLLTLGGTRELTHPSHTLLQAGFLETNVVTVIELSKQDSLGKCNVSQNPIKLHPAKIAIANVSQNPQEATIESKLQTKKAVTSQEGVRSRDNARTGIFSWKNRV
jgi:hypothetical protein